MPGLLSAFDERKAQSKGIKRHGAEPARLVTMAVIDVIKQCEDMS